MQQIANAALLLIVVVILSACESVISPASAPTPAPAGREAPAAVQPDSGVTGETITISFGAREYERAIYEPLIERFTADNPDLRIVFVELESATMTQATAQAADTALVVVPPAAITAGLARDLRPLIDADLTFARADVFPAALQPTAAGSIYVLPRALWAPLLHYNQSLWTASNLPAPQPDWSWADLLAAAEQLAERRGDAITRYGLLDDSGGMQTLLGVLAAGGTPLPTSAGQFDRPAVVAALERTAALVEGGAVYNLFGSDRAVSDTELREMIRDGRLAIWPASMRLTPDNAPFAIGSALQPSLPDMPNVGEGYVISSGTRHPDAAWRWIAWLSHQVVTPADAPPEQIVPIRRSLADSHLARRDSQTAEAVRRWLDQPAPAVGSDSWTQLEALRPAIRAVLRGEQTAAAALREAARTQPTILTPASPPAGDAIPPATPPAGDAIPPATPPAFAVATPMPPPPAGTATITFNSWMLGTYSAGTLQQLLPAFYERHPNIRVRIMDRPPNPDAPVIGLPEIAAGSDCFAWGGIGNNQYQHVIDLQPLIDADAAFPRDEYPAALLQPLRAGRALYGLPRGVSLRALAYEPGVFDAAGLDYPSGRWTLDDLLRAAIAIRQNGSPESFGFATLERGHYSSVDFVLNRRGAALTQGSADEPQPAFTDARVLEGLQWYVDLLRETSPHTRVGGYRQTAAAHNAEADEKLRLLELLDADRIGMWLSFGAPSIWDPRDHRQERIDAAIAPPPGLNRLSASDFWLTALYISSRTQQRDACWAWITFLSEDVTTLGDQFPARRSLAESPAFLAQAPAGAAEVYAAYRPLLDQPLSDNANRYWPFDPFWLWQALDRALQGANLARELEEAQFKTEQHLACTRGGEAELACAQMVDPDYQGQHLGPVTIYRDQ